MSEFKVEDSVRFTSKIKNENIDRFKGKYFGTIRKASGSGDILRVYWNDGQLLLHNKKDIEKYGVMSKFKIGDKVKNISHMWASSSICKESVRLNESDIGVITNIAEEKLDISSNKPGESIYEVKFNAGICGKCDSQLELIESTPDALKVLQSPINYNFKEDTKEKQKSFIKTIIELIHGSENFEKELYTLINTYTN